MRSNKFALGFGVSVLLATASVFAQSPAPCAAEFGRCSAQFPSEFRNVRRSNAPTGTCALGAVYSRDLCAGNFESAQVCAPTVISSGASRNITLAPGESVTVTCSGVAPRRPNRRRVSDTMVAFCDESLGAVASDETSGSCACAPLQGYNAGAPTVVSERVVNNHLVSYMRVAPHAREVRFGCVYVPNGQPRPADQLVLRILAAVVTAQEELARQVRQNTAEVARAHQRLDNLPTPSATPASNAFRLQFDGSFGGLIHWNAGSPVGGVGGGGILRPGIVLRWNDEFGLRIYGGWGMGGQTNTPYALPNPNGGAPIAQSAPLHMGVFGIDGIFGSGSVAAIFGIDGFVAGRTAPVVVPGTLSGLLAWRANVHAGARFRLSGDNTGFQFNLDLVGNAGISNVSAVSADRLFSPTAFGLGGEILFSITR